MKKFRFLTIAAVSALSGAFAVCGHAKAGEITSSYSDGYAGYTVKVSGLYEIIAYGAQGGAGVNSIGSAGVGGLGAEIGGEFRLTKNESLLILAGGRGGGGSGIGIGNIYSSGTFIGGGGGGGGGSFVFGPNMTPLVIAGGGGGGGGDSLVNAYGSNSSGFGGTKAPNGQNGGGGGRAIA